MCWHNLVLNNVLISVSDRGSPMLSHFFTYIEELLPCVGPPDVTRHGRLSAIPYYTMNGWYTKKIYIWMHNKVKWIFSAFSRIGYSKLVLRKLRNQRNMSTKRWEYTHLYFQVFEYTFIRKRCLYIGPKWDFCIIGQFILIFRIMYLPNDITFKKTVNNI